ncbi:uncharacterized protein LOC120011040 [Tripterygium wilfordii]|uniref:uncharacterized protein LOC120011040 n=1 Tax=Tripterygium wilfordii TaxID=458696 RepID=UPI0018F81C4C|nr:uncharacterized protein LOC120011040 [Tripterygium wilfordii]
MERLHAGVNCHGMISYFHKLISLANRLKQTLSLVISDSQSGFIKGRQTMDSILMANEIVDHLKKKRKTGFLLKIDFEKAFDSIQWGFLADVMKKMCYGAKWISWILECISTARVSVLVNGLNQMLDNAKNLGLVEGISVKDGGLQISHLQYADDTILFSSNSTKSLMNLKRVLRCFELISGLKVNYHKSSLVGIGVQADRVTRVADLLQCQTELPMKYLGMPLGGNMKKSSLWDPVVKRVEPDFRCGRPDTSL